MSEIDKDWTNKKTDKFMEMIMQTPVIYPFDDLGLRGDYDGDWKSDVIRRGNKSMEHFSDKIIKANKTFEGYKYIPTNLKVKRIIYNDPATIVFWENGEKTVVIRAEGETPNHYNAFCAALAKHLYGNNSRVNRIVKSGVDEKEKKSKDTKKKG